MVHLGSKRTISITDAERECRAELGGPKPLEFFRKMFEFQGGDWNAFEKQRAEFTKLVRTFTFAAPSAGFVKRVDARALGILLSQLGGGRSAKEDKIDPLVGVRCLKKVGDAVKAGDAILEVYYRTDAEKNIEKSLAAAVSLSPAPVTLPAWIVGTLQ